MKPQTTKSQKPFFDVNTVDSGYSHTKNFQENCDCKRSVTLSRVPLNSRLDDRKSMAKALHWYINYFQSLFSSEVSSLAPVRFLDQVFEILFVNSPFLNFVRFSLFLKLLIGHN